MPGSFEWSTCKYPSAGKGILFFLRGRGDPFDHAWFLNNGTTSHTMGVVMPSPSSVAFVGLPSLGTSLGSALMVLAWCSSSTSSAITSNVKSLIYFLTIQQLGELTEACSVLWVPNSCPTFSACTFFKLLNGAFFLQKVSIQKLLKNQINSFLKKIANT